jgi:hypothetical protein
MIFPQRTAANAVMIVLSISFTSTAFGLMVLSGIDHIAKLVVSSRLRKTAQDQFMQLSYLLVLNAVNSAGKKNLWKNFTQTDAFQTVSKSTEHGVSHVYSMLPRLSTPKHTK